MAGVDWGGLSLFVTALSGLLGTIGALWLQAKRIDRDGDGNDRGRRRHALELPESISADQIADIIEEREKRRRGGALEMRLLRVIRARMIA